ncbi:MAG TPA: hypothetical protein VM120_18635 [Bryobacteraceae bacterium]|nr:hypothetical protein [Bryobacteraceae bacterium]
MKILILAIAALTLGGISPAKDKDKGTTKMAAPTSQSSQAQKWEGRLVDAGRSNCGVETASAAPQGMCPVSVATAHFGLIMPDGKVAKFDEGGNSKAMDALKKSKKGSKMATDFWRTGKTSSHVRASVAGTITGDTLNVESVKID